MRIARARRRPTGLAAALIVCLLPLLAPSGANAAPSADWPIGGAWVRLPVIPDPDWLPGHRGLDLAGYVGQLVRSPVSGNVFWVGEVNHVPAITIRSSGGLKHTLQPVRSNLAAGDPVSRGEPVGTISAGNHCRVACLHWSVREGRQYLDPRWLLPPWVYRLPIHARG